MSHLARFIRDNVEQILQEWESFARGLPIGEGMDVAALRDHAAQMLAFIAADLDSPQTAHAQHQKAMGASDADKRSVVTAAQEHGAGRAVSGFSVAQMVSEFRALRASVTRLWLTEERRPTPADMQDLIRFNESIDQAIAESITRYSGEVGQAKERFLAILGHDLRTPLGAVITSTSFMLETGELREPHLTLVQRISSSSRRMNQLVEDLLDFTRSRFGDSIPIVRADTDLRKIVTDVAAEMGASYPDSAIQVETSGHLRGEWDSARIFQALVNLVGNAVQHGAPDATIQLRARGLPAQVELSVHNDGPLIPRERIARLFHEMSNTRQTGWRDKKHLGLGLYIVDKIVTAHGGTIQVSSTQAAGTTFTIHLPRN